MIDLLALITVMAWPVIPLFWIPVHGFPQFFRRVKSLTYLLPLITWLPLAFLLYKNSDILLRVKIDLPLVVQVIGAFLFVSGTVLHIWTGKLLTIWGLIGVPEIHQDVEGRLVRTGAFAVVRHPTYLAHTLMFSGVFLVTGVLAVSIVTLLDFLIVHTIIIPLEEKELLARFREDYEQYKKEVPGFLPRRLSFRK